MTERLAFRTCLPRPILHRPLKNSTLSGPNRSGSHRTLCARLGTENPRLEDLKLIALAPGEGDRPNFQFLRIWDLQDPAGYYQAVVVPRQERALNRMLHRQLHDVSTKEKKDAVRKTAGIESNEDVPPSDPKSGAARLIAPVPPPDPALPPATGDGKRKAGEQPSKAYPAGKRVAPAEVKRSVSHAPIDPKTKLPICWDAACQFQGSLPPQSRAPPTIESPRLHCGHADDSTGWSQKRS